MIRGIHGMLYSSDPDATRAFFRDQVKLAGSDIGEGWWIFDLPAGDLGVHPTDDPREAGVHDVSLWCDDIHGTVADLRARGVEFTKKVEDHGYGLVTYFTAPGGIKVQLYEPRYVKGASRKARRSVRPARGAARGRPKSRGARPRVKRSRP
jgi:catechol 2,3-dioxygenase-like lactoylglutathione lyase family enzyme